MTTEISSQQKQNDHISPSSSRTLERAGDGNLFPEVRKILIVQIAEHIRKRGRVNISEIARIFKVSRETARNIAYGVQAQWREEGCDQTFALMQWLASVAADIDTNPDSFNEDKVNLIKLNMQVLTKAHALQSAFIKSQRQTGTVNIHLHPLLPTPQDKSVADNAKEKSKTN